MCTIVRILYIADDPDSFEQFKRAVRLQAQYAAAYVEDPGEDCQLGPNVQLLTPVHPVEPQPRKDRLESARPITIGDNSVIGAGAVVTRDIPVGCLALGSPARVVRKL
ncbi:acetyltransferase-like isoleucine patch superfamily enzyme [Catenulispora sp. GAS73]|uniref:hypothetical protein n=1 Tax=Catenulispora sp. GAS73 TaxID=3156269 RepID=UPI003515511C